MKLSLNCVYIHCVWEALNSSTNLSLSLSHTFVVVHICECAILLFWTLTLRCMRAPFFFFNPPPPPKKKIHIDRHKHLQGTNIDIELVCVCVCECACICVWVWVCVRVCVCSCCMHWILTICTSNFHSIKRMNPLVSDETGSPPPPHPFFLFNTPLFFFSFCILQNEISWYPLWFSWNMDPSEALYWVQ